MKLILAGWLTIGLALIWNRFLYCIAIPETVRVEILVPIGEELLKYSISYLTKLFPPLLFASFGFGEGIYESIHYKKRFDLILVLAGILPHTFFSIFYLFKMPVWLSLVSAIVSHSVWNHIVFKFQK